MASRRAMRQMRRADQAVVELWNAPEGVLPSSRPAVLPIARSLARVEATMIDKPPQIRTVEGIGVEYLIWTREEILALQERVENLEDSIRHLRGEGSDD